MGQKLGGNWDSRHGKRERAQNNCTEVRKENIWTRKRELWRIRTNVKIKDTLQDEDIKFRESLRLRCYGQGEKKAKPKISKTNCNIYNGRKKERENIM
jgi:hypothetical protein